MEVILRQAVEKLGHPGDVVTVSPGYARNYLLPRGFAYEATAGNKKRIEQEKQRLDQAEEQRRTSAQGLAGRLEAVSITFSARVGEEGKLFGSVTSSDRASSARAALSYSSVHSTRSRNGAVVARISSTWPRVNARARSAVIGRVRNRTSGSPVSQP